MNKMMNMKKRMMILKRKLNLSYYLMKSCSRMNMMMKNLKNYCKKKRMRKMMMTLKMMSFVHCCYWMKNC